jgi:RimJ/RimL family protein N-acetyltransferase
MSGKLALVPYDAVYLEKSWRWLRDPEIKTLTLTPDFDRADQRRFFDGLARRSDYLVWGVELSGQKPIGAAGLKHIRERRAEYWGYIGDKEHWGQGLGGQMLEAIEKKALELGIDQLYLTVGQVNTRAISLYLRHGFVADDPSADPQIMTKALQA